MQKNNILHTITDQRGSSLIEAAFALPVVISVIFGVIQWGIILAYNATLLNATAAGGRFAITGDGSPYMCSEIQSAAVSAAQALMVPSCTATGACLPTPVGTTVVVTCTYQLNLLFPYVVPGQVNGVLSLSESTTVS